MNMYSIDRVILSFHQLLNRWPRTCIITFAKSAECWHSLSNEQVMVEFLESGRDRLIEP